MMSSSTKDKFEDEDDEVDNLFKWCKIRLEASNRGDIHKTKEEALMLRDIIKVLNPKKYQSWEASLLTLTENEKVNLYNEAMYCEVIQSLLYLAQQYPRHKDVLRKHFYQKNNKQLDKLGTWLLMMNPEAEYFFSNNDIKKHEYNRYYKYRKNNSKSTKSITELAKWKLSDRKHCKTFPQYYPNPFAYWWNIEASQIRESAGRAFRNYIRNHKKSYGGSGTKIAWEEVIKLLLSEKILADEVHRKFTIKLVVGNTLGMIRFREKYFNITSSPVDDRGYFIYGHEHHSWSDAHELIKIEENGWNFLHYKRMLYIVYASWNQRQLAPDVQNPVLNLIEAVYEIEDEDSYYYEEDLPHCISTLVDELIAIDNELHHKGVDPNYQDDRGFVRTMVPMKLW